MHKNRLQIINFVFAQTWTWILLMILASLLIAVNLLIPKLLNFFEAQVYLNTKITVSVFLFCSFVNWTVLKPSKGIWNFSRVSYEFYCNMKIQLSCLYHVPLVLILKTFCFNRSCSLTFSSYLWLVLSLWQK